MYDGANRRMNRQNLLRYLRYSVGFALFVACPLVVVGVTVFSISDSAKVHFPRIVMERSRDAGRLDLHQPYECQFEVRNSGDAPLLIHEAHAACHCQGVYWLSESGAKMAIHELVIPPSASATLGVDFVATGELNLPSLLSITLSTNDPSDSKISMQITYTSTARLYFVPNTVVFGDVSLGSTVSRIIDVFADGRAEKIEQEKLKCSSDDLFTVRYIPQPQREGEAKLGGSIASQIGHLEITLRAPKRH